MRFNVGLREKTDSDSTIRTFFSGESYQITADKRQILEFLLSVYEDLYRNNKELVRLDRELLLLNEHLEKRVEERTATLTQEISERKRVEEALRESEERYRELFEHIFSCVAIYEAVDDRAEFRSSKISTVPGSELRISPETKLSASGLQRYFQASLI